MTRICVSGAFLMPDLSWWVTGLVGIDNGAYTCNGSVNSVNPGQKNPPPVHMGFSACRIPGLAGPRAGQGLNLQRVRAKPSSVPSRLGVDKDSTWRLVERREFSLESPKLRASCTNGAIFSDFWSSLKAGTRSVHPIWMSDPSNITKGSPETKLEGWGATQPSFTNPQSSLHFRFSTGKNRPPNFEVSL